MTDTFTEYDASTLTTSQPDSRTDNLKASLS